MLAMRYLIRILALILLISVSAYSNSFKATRVSLQIGYPNLAGISAEYVVPQTEGKLGFQTDFSYIPLSFTDLTDDIKKLNVSPLYFSFGSHYYFTGNGEGFYSGLSYSYWKFKGDANGLKGNGKIVTEDANGNEILSSNSYSYINGSADLEYPTHIFQLYIGYRAIAKNNFTFTPQIAVGISTMTDKPVIYVEDAKLADAPNGSSYKLKDDFNVPLFAFLKVGFSFGYAF